MSATAKRPRTEDPSTVNISVKSQDGNQMFFMIKRHVPMKRLLSNYCEKKPLIQMASFIASTTAMYSASVVDNATVDCKVAFQLIAVSPRVNT
ncbi:hypothetical protein ACOSQ2_006734 [Xanthoceras sorbifolium]